MPLGSELAVSRVMPQGFTDNQLVPPRGSKYREVYVQNIINGDVAAADEGSLFVAGNTTPGTGVKFGSDTSTAFSDTASGGMVFINTDAPGGKRCYLRWIKLTLTAVSAGDSTAGVNFAFKLDSLITRYTSGATFVTSYSPNGDSGAKAVTLVGTSTGGTSLTFAASSQNARVIDTYTPIRNVIGVLGDVIQFNFGGNEGTVAVTPTNGLNPLTCTLNSPPAIIGPQGVFSVHLWAASRSTAPTYAWTACWVER